MVTCFRNSTDPRRAKALRGRVLGFVKEFKSKPFREQDKDLLGIEIRKEMLHKVSSPFPDGEEEPPFNSNEGFYKLSKIS